MSDLSNYPTPFRNSYDGIQILKAERKPCPVCGHPTGDCQGELVKPDHIIGENLEIQSLKHERMILVEEDVFEDREVTPHTSARVLIHRAGSYVTRQKAIELGILKI